MARTKKETAVAVEVKNPIEIIESTTPSSEAAPIVSETPKVAPSTEETPQVEAKTEEAPKAKTPKKVAVKKSSKVKVSVEATPTAQDSSKQPVASAPKKRGRKSNAEKASTAAVKVKTSKKTAKKASKSSSKAKTAANGTITPTAAKKAVKRVKKAKNVKSLVKDVKVKEISVAAPQPIKVSQPYKSQLTQLVDKECKKNVTKLKNQKKLAHHAVCLKIQEVAQKYGIPYGYVAYIAVGTSAQKPAEFGKGYTSFDEAKMARVIKLEAIAKKYFKYNKASGAFFHMLSSYYNKFKGNMSFFKAAIANVPAAEFKMSNYKTVKELSDLFFAVSEK